GLLHLPYSSAFSLSESPGACKRCEAENRYVQVTRITRFPRSNRRTGRASRTLECLAVGRPLSKCAEPGDARYRWRCSPPWALHDRKAALRNSETGDRKAGSLRGSPLP